jgi:PAS domain S-box-containing protein
VLQDGILKFANAKFASSTGYTVEELISRSFVELIHPDDRQMAVDYYFRRLKGQHVPPLYQCRFVDRAGNTKWTEVNAVLLDWEGRTATLALLGDITERKRSDDALKASEERFRTLIEESTDAIAILDAGGNLLYESPSMERVTGYKLEDWLGTPVGDWLLHPDDMAAMASLLERDRSSELAKKSEYASSTKTARGTSLKDCPNLADPNVNGLVFHAM